MTGMYFPEKKLAYAMSIICKTVNYISIKYKKYHVTFSQNCTIYFQNKIKQSVDCMYHLLGNSLAILHCAVNEQIYNINLNNQQ